MESKSEPQPVTIDIEIQNPRTGQALYRERFTHTPKTHYRDPNSRLFQAKLAFRERWRELTADPTNPLHQYEGQQVYYHGELVKDGQ